MITAEAFHAFLNIIAWPVLPTSCLSFAKAADHRSSFWVQPSFIIRTAIKDAVSVPEGHNPHSEIRCMHTQRAHMHLNPKP
jgi:hypothetical protein